MFLVELQARERAGKPIRVAVVGLGDFGLGVAAQLRQMAGVRLTLGVDLDEPRAYSALEKAGYGSSGERPVVSRDAASVPASDADVVVDCTGSTTLGAQLALESIRAGKHVVMVNVEADVVVGAALRREADAAGVVYTTADGDQPSLTAGLVEWCRMLGFRVVSAGKGTSLFGPESVRRRMAAGVSWSTVAFLDGTKSQIEMASVANMTGLAIDTVGFHKPRLTLEQVADTLIPRTNGGLLAGEGVVDFVNCLGEDDRTVINHSLVHGVFAVITSDNSETMELLRGKGCPTSRCGRYALIVRPYHLCGAETPTSIVQAVLFGKGTGSPLPTPVADVVAVAKRALPAGTLLDGIGREAVCGVAYPYAVSHAHGMLPVGMAQEVRLARPVAEGGVLTWADLAEHGTDALWQLRRTQDRLFAHPVA